ncbi:MAG: IPT/TIG domain-containing protein [Myxococcota bacterium]|nr:IPT/TIG domain-containing protein [Myxococcota bacterium]
MFALLLACTAAPPTLSAVDPGTAKPGDSLTLIGADFQQGATATAGGQDLAVEFKGAVQLVGTVPELAAGAHTVIVANPDGQSATLPGALTIPEPPAVLKICDPDQTAYTQLAGGRELIKIDVHHKGIEEPERLEIGFREVAGVQYEGRVQGDALCSAIVLELKDGRRLVYEDSKELNLKKKAQELAQVVGVGIDVVADEALPQE